MTNDVSAPWTEKGRPGFRSTRTKPSLNVESLVGESTLRLIYDANTARNGSPSAVTYHKGVLAAATDLLGCIFLLENCNLVLGGSMQHAEILPAAKERAARAIYQAISISHGNDKAAVVSDIESVGGMDGIRDAVDSFFQVAQKAVSPPTLEVG